MLKESQNEIFLTACKSKINKKGQIIFIQQYLCLCALNQYLNSNITKGISLEHVFKLQVSGKVWHCFIFLPRLPKRRGKLTVKKHVLSLIPREWLHNHKNQNL